MALAGVELETLVSETDALTTRPPVASEYLYMISKARQTEGLPTSVRVKSSA